MTVKRTKRLLALLLSLMLALSLLPTAALAAEEEFITRKDFVMKLYEHPAFGMSELTSSSAVAFVDLDGCTDAEKNAFGVMRDKGILTGTMNGEVNPSGLLLRYEAAMLIWRSAGSVSSGEPGALPYADVPEDNKMVYDAINSLYAQGILTDKDMDGDGNFNPYDNVTVSDAEAWLEAFIETGSGITGTVDDEADPEELAAELQSLGLFKGTGTLSDGSTNFDLNRAPTRAEALVMLIRILGKEDEALAGSWSHTFKDVPAWADPHIGYAYQNHLANGNSSTEYGSNEEATVYMYLTFVLRALGYSDAEGDFVWDQPYALAAQAGILPHSVDLVDFQRGDLVVVSAAALNAKLKGSEQTLAEKLMEDGAFTQEQYSQTVFYKTSAD